MEVNEVCKKMVKKDSSSAKTKDNFTQKTTSSSCLSPRHGRAHQCTIGPNVDVPSDESDGDDWKNLRRKRIRKGKFRRGVGTSFKAKDILGLGVVASQQRFCSTDSLQRVPTPVGDSNMSGKLFSTPVSCTPVPVRNPRISTSSSACSNDLFLATQNLDEDVVSQPQSRLQSPQNDNLMMNESRLCPNVNTNCENASTASSFFEHSFVVDNNNINAIENRNMWTIFSAHNPVWDYIFKWEGYPLPFNLEQFRDLTLDAVDKAGLDIPSAYRKRKLCALRVREKHSVIDKLLVIKGTWCGFTGGSSSIIACRPQVSSSNGTGSDGQIKISSSFMQVLLLKLVKENDIILLFHSERHTSHISSHEDAYLIHLSSEPNLERLDFSSEIPSEIEVDMFFPNLSKGGYSSVIRFALQSQSPSELCKENSIEVCQAKKTKRGASNHTANHDIEELLDPSSNGIFDVAAPVDDEDGVVERIEDIPEITAEAATSTSKEDLKFSQIARKSTSLTKNPSKALSGHVSLKDSAEGYPQGKTNERVSSGVDSHEIHLLDSTTNRGVAAPEEDIDALIGRIDESPLIIGSGTATSNEVSKSPQRENSLNLPKLLPGPVRPRVRKASGDRSYVYQKLADLEKRIQEIEEDAIKANRVICPMIPDQCHVYGLVEDVRNDLNSYSLRICDETKKFVLVRLPNSTQITGPPIQAGDIIRIHRTTVQKEWDKELEYRAMVISTPSHLNYVIFRLREGSNNEFYYNTIAKSITFDDEIELARIAELHQLTSSLLRGDMPESEDVEEVQNLPSTVLTTGAPSAPRAGPSSQVSLGEQRLSANVTVPRQSETPSDGINISDLETPLSSVDEEMFGKSDVGNAHASSSLRVLAPKAVNVLLSCSSCTSDVTAPPSQNVSISSQREDEGQVREPENLNTESDDELLVLYDDQAVQTKAALKNSGQILESRVVFTGFGDLKRLDNDKTINLLFRAVSLMLVEDSHVFHLVMTDFDAQKPSKDFVREFPHFAKSSITGTDLALRDDILILNITNAKRFYKREIMRDISNFLGTVELFVAENVRIKGSSPPYQLEVDGESCVIRETRPEDLAFLHLDDTFSESFDFETAVENVPLVRIDVADDVAEENVIPVDLNTNPTSNNLSKEDRNKNLDTERSSSGNSGRRKVRSSPLDAPISKRIRIDRNSEGVIGSDSESVYMSAASNISSPGINVNDNQNVDLTMQAEVVAEWRGELPGKRYPRIFFLENSE